MSEQKMKWKLGGTTYLREEPDGTVKRDACLYVMYSNPLQEFIGPSRIQKIKKFASGRTGWGPESQFRKRQEMPAIPFWHYEHFDCEANAVAEMLTDYLITDDRADWMTDIFCWTPFNIVRERVRDFLEDTDPGGNLFFPVRLYTETSRQELPGRFYTWLPKRRLFLSPDFPTDHQQKRVWTPFSLSFGTRNIASEFTNNHALREFAGSLPSFGLSFGAQTAFNPPMFRALKAEKFTGLVEREHYDRFKKDNKNWNVGHFE